MLPESALRAAVAYLPIHGGSGLAFRLLHAKYAGTALSSLGSLRFGGRYNAPGTYEALYLADSPITALRETAALIHTAAGLLGVRGPPRILLSVEYTLGAIVDLTDPSVQAALGTHTDELCAPWRLLNAAGQPAPTQVLGGVVHASGRMEALKVPSARDRHAYNLVVFPARLAAGSALRVYDDSGIIDAHLP